MEGKLNPKTVFKYSKDKIIYSEGKPTTSIAIILKGKAVAYNKGAKVTMEVGDFLGLHDLFYGNYQMTYKAAEPLIIHVFPISRTEELKAIITENKDYGGIMVMSLNNYIKELDGVYQLLVRHRVNLFQFLKENYKEYTDFASRFGYKVGTSTYIQDLRLQEDELHMLSERIEYYKQISQIPIDVVKAFFSYGKDMTLYQLGEQAEIVKEQIKTLEELANEVSHMVENLAGKEGCLFYLVANLAIEVKNANKSSSDVVDIMDRITGQINTLDKISQNNVGHSLLKVDRKMMEGAYNLILSEKNDKERSVKSHLKYTDKDANEAANELSNAFEKLLAYSKLPQKKAEEMKDAMADFVNLRDRMSSDRDARAIRKKLSNNHYILYKEIFLKAYKDKDVPRIVDLFLKYGFADERLLSKDQLLSLYYLEDITSSETFAIYNIKDWLTLIYEGKKEPSKNEFDQEYSDMLLHMKRQGKLTDKDIKEWTRDKDKKLEYEIENLFKTNNRLANGQISTFVPVLHQDIVFKEFDKILMSGENLEQTIMELLKTDPSIFAREVVYSDEEKGVTREFIIKKVYPEFILMPTAGNKSVMWQEISSKRRDNPGRFVLPIFFDDNLQEEVVKLFGRFRWEMCRTIEGVYWNDIRRKSLTSEYSDFLQFYRKNRDLSEEKKNQVKSQIQKGRRSSREIFTLDYEQWILYEARGAIKLSKPVREILATYCPFSKEIRKRIERQPLFKDSMLRFEREKLKKIRELENRKRKMEKEGFKFTKELEETLEYYKNL